MDDENICLDYVNIPSEFYIALICRGFDCISSNDPRTYQTICVNIKPGRAKYYPLLPTKGEAIVNTIDELDTLLMIKSLGDDDVLREYIKTTHSIHLTES